MADEVRERMTGIIGFADQGALDLLRLRAREQEVPAARTRPVVVVSRFDPDGHCSSLLDLGDFTR